MSSGFVPGGSTDDARDEAWQKVQADLEERKKQREEQGAQEGGKSLFEVLEANKAAKQEAFEEATRLKNQYRALDDDEAEFLDSVLEATRKQEAAIEKDTLEQLDAFRKHQEEVERKALIEQNAGEPPSEGMQWAVSRKRKKGEKDGVLLKGVKLRKASSSADTGSGVKEEKNTTDSVTPKSREAVSVPDKLPQPSTTTKSASPPAPAVNALALGLGYASSDEDD